MTTKKKKQTGLPLGVHQWALAALHALKEWEESPKGSEKRIQAAGHYCRAQEQVVSEMQATDNA